MTTELKLSYSRMKTYRQCSEAYRLKYQQGLPDRPAWYSVGGSAVHMMTQRLDEVQVGTYSDLDLKTFEEYFYEEQVQQEGATGVPPEEWKTAGRKTKAMPRGEDREWWLNNGPSMVNRWLNWRDSIPMDLWVTPDGEPAIELEFEFPIEDDTTVRGAIDRVYQHRQSGLLVVIDIKTGKPPTDVVQLGTYAEAIAQRYGSQVDFGGYWMARGGVLTGLHDLRPDKGGRMWYDYQQVAKAIKAEVFIASPSKLCDYCSFQPMCYAQGDKRTTDEFLPFPEVKVA